MNIFVLDLDPKIAARLHCDKHVPKMIVESTQMLTNAYYSVSKNEQNIKEMFKTFPRIDSYGEPKPYMISHYNHPCSIWVRKSLDNFEWLISLSHELCIEYTKRFGKRHVCQDYIEWFNDNLPKIERKGLTSFATAMPLEYVTDNAVESYQKYYVSKESYMKMEYRLGNKPEFFKNK